MHAFRRPLAIAAIALALLPLGACNTLGRRGGNGLETRYVARDVNSLYNAGLLRLQARDYAVAGAIFDEVERQHPYSVWARRAQLMSAFSYYAAGDHTKSINSARRFLAIHPGNRDAPYALYLMGINFYEQITDVTRDQAATRQALTVFGELVRRYPATPYAEDARLKLDLVRDHLAGREMEIGRFYQRRQQWLASVYRFRTVVDQYQSTAQVPEALMRLTESYLALGVPVEARRAAAVLGANYPETQWYQRAFRLIQRDAANVDPGTAEPGAPDPVAPERLHQPPTPEQQAQQRQQPN
jgi:outer membrane protein assembly factor BamD